MSLQSAPITAEHLAWRGKWRDMTSLYYWGARPYDAECRTFLSADPLGHAADASLYSAFNGSPSVYWDADGRFGKQYAQFQYNGGAAGYGLRGLAGALNSFGSSSRSTYLSFGAFNDASLLNMAAGAISPSSYVNGYNNLQNRAENVMVGQYLSGSGSTWSAAQGLSSIVGDATGYNGVMEGGFGVDRQSQTMLSMSDRWSQGLMGGSQMILTGVGLKAAYNPNATFWTGNEGVMSGQVASSYPQNRRVGGRGEGVRAIDPPAGFQEACAWDLTPDNLRLMEAGRPPIGRDGLPVELHHRNQNPLGPLDEMTSTTHDTIDHPISPSQINRSLFAGERARFWRQRARQLLGQQ